MIEFAHLLAWLALSASLAQAGFGLAGRDGVTRRVALAGFGLVTISFAGLVTAFLRSDFSVDLVANHSHTMKPLLYKFAGTWGNHEGSMLLWCVVVSGFAAAAALALKRREASPFAARTLGVQGVLAAASLAYLLFASNPFLRDAIPPPQGADLNPLLQDPALAIHPPFLFLGYVGLSFAFSLAAAGLLERRIDRAWAKTARPWVLWSWVFLTIGIGLGSYWAYYELGWGGWWFWDPVENASLMPWLIGTALLHSLIVTEKRGGLAAWTALLAVLAFCFSMLGAFLVRSGILTSVHAFAVDPERGAILLVGLILLGGGALTLFAMRAGSLNRGPEFAPVSREGALVANNVVLGVVTLTVLAGTLYPLMEEAVTGEKASVGPPYYNLVVGLLMLPLFALLPIVQSWSWGRAKTPRLHLALGVLAGLCVAAVAFALSSIAFSIFAALTLVLGLWLVGGAVFEIGRRALWRWDRLGRLNLRIWGMTLAHAGLGLFLIGAVWETSARMERTLVLAEGQSARFAGWTLTLDEIRRGQEGRNWFADRATLTATRGNREVVLTPEKRFYPAARMPTTETAIHRTGTGDLYVALGERRSEDGRVGWSFNVYFNPLVDLVFLGMILVALGGGLAAVSAKRARQRNRAQALKDAPA